AVDKGANQPNAFPDPKSAEATLPTFSNGGRDDGIQRAFLEAVLSYWDPDDPAFEPAGNPVSTVYGDRMLEIARSFAWAWDARPFPAFPHMLDVWADGDNWSTGHWLSGRLGGASLAGLVSAILDHAGFADYDVSALRGVVDGYVIDRPMAARNALEPLFAVGLIEVVDTGTILRLRSRQRGSAAAISGTGLVEDRGQPLVTVKRAQETELPAQVAIGFTGNLVDFRRAVVTSRRLVGGSRRETRIEFAAVMDGALAERTAEFWLHDSWAGRENYKFSLPLSAIALEPGDVVTLDYGGRSRLVQLTTIAEAGRLRLEARTVEPTAKLEPPTAARLVRDQPVLVYGKPHALVLDLPLLPGDGASTGARIAALADPWPGAIAVYRSPAADGFSLVQTVGRPATIGTLLTGLDPGPVAVWDRGNLFEVELSAGALSGRMPDQIFNGANAAAIGSVSTGFEILQFETAELIAENTYRLGGLVRAQAGTEDIMAAGHGAGATFILLDGAVELLTLDADQIGLPLNYRVGPAGLDLGNDAFDGFVATVDGRGLLPLSPVHLGGWRDQTSGDVTFDWIRRTRIGGDSWTAVDVPLGEAAEAYRLEILDGGIVKRVVETTASAATYTAAEQYADFAAYPDSFEIRVAQLSATVGVGIARTATVVV
ncbi:MAG: glycoside hydrolase TIM-barrel-like domain-containing protein, partial [Hyphomicrobiales bacterium]|nr:glycoside hydrolase TIM-barrel-like domain-containing protein [Hyphomicrobiales bacterium]